MKNYILHLFQCRFGTGGVITTNNLIYSVFLPQKDKIKIIKRAKKICSTISILENSEIEIIKDLIKYFEGIKLNFSKYKIYLDCYTAFQKKILLETRKINYGETTTYKNLAQRIKNKNSYRAVGNALGKNKLPIIIPCHRVIKKNSIGGYSEGIKWKKKLLKLENNSISQ